MPQRRAWMLGVAATVLAPLRPGPARAQPQAASQPQSQPQLQPGEYGDPASADRWMQAWIASARTADPTATKAPNGALHLGRFADPIYYLTSVIGWDPEPAQASTYQPVRVPIGFVTDFASIPRVFWSLLRPDGTYSYAAVIHDYLYWEQYLSRDASDAILRLCMEDFRIDATVVGAVYAGVRLGGGFAWDANARRKAAGERRVIRRFPTDPRVSWDEWKRNSDVF
jgi:Protein of unknown function (DUF1353)